MNYYNEIDPFAAEWLRQLIKAGHIAPGEVDTRSIEDVFPGDLNGYTQCHFFAGIGGWSYALRLAGWPDSRPVWTGSCPCQPFSAAGQRKGAADERHLWPALFHLVSQCAPSVLFGEQVASKDGLRWFDTVRADLESAGYAAWAADLCAAGIGAPHIRQRLYFVAHDSRTRLQERERDRRVQQEAVGSFAGQTSVGGGHPSELDKSASEGLAQRAGGTVLGGEALGELERPSNPGFWEAHDEIWCIDGRTRPIEPSTFPLVDGVPNRVGRLRGYGNAIVAPLAQAFIESYLEVAG